MKHIAEILRSNPISKWRLLRAINFMINLSGKVALLTGASRGIGAASAIMFAQAGARAIVINYVRNREAAESVAATCKQHGAEVLIQRADVSRLVAVEKMVKATVARF